MDLLIEEPRRFDRLCVKLTLGVGFQRVKKHRGQAGIDGVSIEDFEVRLDEELSNLQQELVRWTYPPSPVRRVEIPKPGGQGVRLLGIPTVRDRVVQAALQRLLEPWFEPGFSPHSYGFRPGRSQHQAVRAGHAIIASGKPFVVDIDLSKFFDRIPHDRLIARMSRTVDDKRVLRLVGLMLRRGVMDRGVEGPSTEGTLQGGPLSPLLSNIVLDELDQELERRGLAFCRFADDGNSFVKTPKAATRVMASISRFIEQPLKLQVNREKSQVAPAERGKFLGFTVVKGTLAMAHKALQAAMNKVRELTPRGTPPPLEVTLAVVNEWYTGWSNYYSLTADPAPLQKIAAHKKRKPQLYRRLVERGVPRGQAAKAGYSNDSRWALSATRAVTKAYPNSGFIHQKGQVIRSDQKLAHWLAVSQWISLA
jgi:group II intron reverse transcriptase/maturase